MSYGKIASKFWNALAAQSDATRLMAAYIRSSQHRNMLGAFRLPAAYAAHDLRWTVEKTEAAFADLLRLGVILRDAEDWTYVVGSAAEEPPENENQIKARSKFAMLLPEGKIFEAVDQEMVAVLKSSDELYEQKQGHKRSKISFETLWRQSVSNRITAGTRTVPQPFRNQEPEPEPEPITEPEPLRLQGQPAADAPTEASVDEPPRTLPALFRRDEEQAPPEVPTENHDLDIPLQFDATPAGEIARMWNEICVPVGLSGIDKITAKRKKLIAGRLKDVDANLDAIRAAFVRASVSSFCLGKRSNGTHSNWRADFNFVMREDPFNKLREGAYDDKRGPNGTGPGGDAQVRQDRSQIMSGLGLGRDGVGRESDTG